MLKRQHGFSLPGWAAILLVGGLIVICAVKMVPAYIDNLYVQDALKFIVQNNTDLQSLEKREIKSQLSKYFIINSVQGINKDTFKVWRHPNGLIIDAVYEIRTPILANVDVVMSFKNQLDLANPKDCCKYKLENVEKSE